MINTRKTTYASFLFMLLMASKIRGSVVSSRGPAAQSDVMGPTASANRLSKKSNTTNYVITKVAFGSYVVYLPSFMKSV